MGYLHLDEQGRVKMELDDHVVEGEPEVRILASMATEIWRWDALVDRIEVSLRYKSVCKLATLTQLGDEGTVDLRWIGHALPLLHEVKLVVADLPAGVYAVAWSNLPEGRPGDCRLSTEAAFERGTRLFSLDPRFPSQGI